MMSNRAQGDTDTYSPEFLAEDNSQQTIDASIAGIVFITAVYATFLTSRLFYSERNYWEFWVLYPLSYLVCLGLCIGGIRESLQFDIFVPCEVSTCFSMLISDLKFLLKSEVQVDIWPIG